MERFDSLNKSNKKRKKLANAPHKDRRHGAAKKHTASEKKLLLQRRRIVIEKRAKKDFRRKSVELQQEVQCLKIEIAGSQ